MPTGYPGTGPTAGRKRDRSEPPRRRGRMSQAERRLLRTVALDQPGSSSEAALERNIDRLARTLRRSPYAVRRALAAEAKLGRDAREVYEKLEAFQDRIEFIRGFFRAMTADAGYSPNLTDFLWPRGASRRGPQKQFLKDAVSQEMGCLPKDVKPPRS